MNAWVAQETKGLIKTLLLKGAFESSSLTLIRANGLYFNGKWENEFSEFNTRISEFNLIDGNPRFVHVPL